MDKPGIKPSPKPSGDDVGVSWNRAAAGLSGATILVVIALSPGGLALMESVLLGCASLVVLATFAPVLPLLHRIPMIGAPKVELRLTIGDNEDLIVPDPSVSIVLRLGLLNSGRGELERGRLNLLVSEPTTIESVDAFGDRQRRQGQLMPPTSEQLKPGANSTFWYERDDFDSGWTMLHYKLQFGAPGDYPVRVKFRSKSIFGDVQEDYVIRVLEGGTS